MKGQRVIHSSAKTGGSDDWRTPRWLFDGLHGLFGFTGDAAADNVSTLCPRWLGPGSPDGEDALATDWGAPGGRDLWWCNPPYTHADAFIRKAYAQAFEGRAATMLLVRSSTDTAWYHDLVQRPVLPSAQQRTIVSFLPIQSRLRFTLGDGTLQKQPAPFPSALLLVCPVYLWDYHAGARLATLHVHGSQGISLREQEGFATRWREVIATPGRRERKAA